jgi:hypothetical protein
MLAIEFTLPGSLEPDAAAVGQVARACHRDGLLVLTSWGRIGMEDMDLGGGRPARVIANMEMTVLPSSVMCPLCSKKDGSDGSGDGVNVVAFCVREEHADRFHEELARLR